MTIKLIMSLTIFSIIEHVRQKRKFNELFLTFSKQITLLMISLDRDF